MRSSEMAFLKHQEIGDLLFLLSHYWKFGILGEKLHVKKKSLSHSDLCKDFPFLTFVQGGRLLLWTS